MISLVTGATGFIGRRLVRRLLQRHGPASVICLLLSPGATAEAEALELFRATGVRTIPCDLVDRPVSGEPPPAVDVVYHLAANTDTLSPPAKHKVNDEGVRNLLDWLRPVSPGVRVVYASSVAVHDRSGPPSAPIDEESPLVPRTAYGASKLRGEGILRERAAGDGYSWTIVRLPTVYGPGQKRDGLFDTFIELARAKSALGRIDWPGRTSIIYVDDAVDAMIELAVCPAAAGRIFCVASDESMTVGELARRIGRAAGHDVRPIRLPRPVLGAMRAVAWNRWVAAAAPAAARQRLWQLSLMVNDGFWFDTARFRKAYTKPLRTLEEGLADTVVGARG